MPLAVGVRLGPYQVLAALGGGGMGEVYRARDARLGRDASADGKRFVLLQPVGSNPSAMGITIVQNWFAEFRNRK